MSAARRRRLAGGIVVGIVVIVVVVVWRERRGNQIGRETEGHKYCPWLFYFKGGGRRLCEANALPWYNNPVRGYEQVSYGRVG